jgi:hypothetical protein
MKKPLAATTNTTTTILAARSILNYIPPSAFFIIENLVLRTRPSRRALIPMGWKLAQDSLHTLRSDPGEQVAANLEGLL